MATTLRTPSRRTTSRTWTRTTRSTEHTARRPLMRTVHIAPWLKTALHASSHPCMCTCVLRCGCFFSSPVSVLYFVPPFSFQPFQMFSSEFNERSRSNPLCDFRLGTVATSDHETPLTSSVDLRSVFLQHHQPQQVAQPCAKSLGFLRLFCSRA